MVRISASVLVMILGSVLGMLVGIHHGMVATGEAIGVVTGVAIGAVIMTAIMDIIMAGADLMDLDIIIMTDVVNFMAVLIEAVIHLPVTEVTTDLHIETDRLVIAEVVQVDV